MSYGPTMHGMHRPPQIAEHDEKGRVVAMMLCHAHHRGLRRAAACADCWAVVFRFGFRPQQRPLITQRGRPARLVPVFWKRGAGDSYEKHPKSFTSIGD